MRALVGFILWVSLTTASSAEVCPKCGRDHGATTAVTSAQSIAQARANHLARVGRVYHPPRSVGDWTRVARFEGTGGSSGNRQASQVPTCTPRGRMMLVADATARGRNGWIYRVRLWR